MTPIDAILAHLQAWRDHDREDLLILSRHQICSILNELERLKKMRRAAIVALPSRTSTVAQAFIAQ